MITGYFNMALVQKGEDGKDGTSPTVYRIVASRSSLVYSYNSNNTLVGSQSLSIKVTEQHGTDEIVTHASEPGPIWTYAGYDGSVGRASAIYGGITISASEASSHQNYTVEIWLGQMEYGGTLVDKVTIPIVKSGTNGGRGPMGAKPRQSEWKPDTRYLEGAANEEFYDIVDYGGYMYLCLNTHTSSADFPPPKSSNWRLEFSQPFITTSTLRAQRIYADQIDGNGLRAVNADISGKITATEGQIGDFSIVDSTLSVSSNGKEIILGKDGLKSRQGSYYARMSGGSIYFGESYKEDSSTRLDRAGLYLYGNADVESFKFGSLRTSQYTQQQVTYPSYNFVVFYGGWAEGSIGSHLNLSSRQYNGYEFAAKNMSDVGITLIGNIMLKGKKEYNKEQNTYQYTIPPGQQIHLIFYEYWFEI